MDHVSIVIVHYNTDKDTRECLASLTQLETPDFNYSVVVVDNASKKPFKLPQTILADNIEIIRSEANLGFTGGNNLGIKHAIEKFNSEYVLLLNSDTLVKPDFLAELYHHFKQGDHVGLMCPKIYFAKGYEFHKKSYHAPERGKIFWYAGGAIDWRNLEAFHRGVDEVDRGQFDHQTMSDFATGCCVLIGREVLETVGLFDNRYFLYMEDVDLSWRAVRRGYAIGFCPSSVVWHKNAGSSGGSGSGIHQYYQTRNRIWFALRYGNWRTRLTALRFAFKLLVKGEAKERKAIFDLITGQMGKQPIV